MEEWQRIASLHWDHQQWKVAAVLDAYFATSSVQSQCLAALLLLSMLVGGPAYVGKLDQLQAIPVVSVLLNLPLLGPHPVVDLAESKELALELAAA